MKVPIDLKQFEKARERFTEFVIARGSSILVTTNEFELIRFTTPEGVGIVYRNSKGNILEKHWQNGARRAFAAFIDSSIEWRVTPRQNRMGRADRVVRAVLKRDGARCFYCKQPFSEDDPPTREHFVARTHEGPDNVYNLGLAHFRCNNAVGHLSVAEKLEFAISLRIAAGLLALPGAISQPQAVTGELNGISEGNENGKSENSEASSGELQTAGSG